jgi:hypothetical protein
LVSRIRSFAELDELTGRVPGFETTGSAAATLVTASSSGREPPGLVRRNGGPAEAKAPQERNELKKIGLSTSVLRVSEYFPDGLRNDERYDEILEADPQTGTGLFGRPGVCWRGSTGRPLAGFYDFLCRENERGEASSPKGDAGKILERHVYECLVFVDYVAIHGTRFHVKHKSAMLAPDRVLPGYLFSLHEASHPTSPSSTPRAADLGFACSNTTWARNP